MIEREEDNGSPMESAGSIFGGERGNVLCWG